MITAGPMRLLTLGGLAVIIGIVVVTLSRSDQAEAPSRSSNPVASAEPPRPQVPVADVKLEMLKGEPTEFGETERNPFRFRQRPAAVQPQRPVTAAPAPIPMPPMPAGPPPPPPIALRYYGLVDAPTQGGRVAWFSDGRGNVFYGREGDIIEGRYRVVRVGPDSAELAYLDGRGRQTIRLSGQ